MREKRGVRKEGIGKGEEVPVTVECGGGREDTVGGGEMDTDNARVGHNLILALLPGKEDTHDHHPGVCTLEPQKMGHHGMGFETIHYSEVFL